MNNIVIRNFVDNLNSLSSSNVNEVLQKNYVSNIEFIDPIKRIHGLEELTNYFLDLYKSVDYCHFKINNYISCEDRYSIQWEMKLRHQRLSKKEEIILDGASFIRFQDNKACYHRDYYDLGALIYERMPVLGGIVKKIRNAF